MPASIVRFIVVGNALYVLTVVIALVSAPLCLLVDVLIALYYTFSQIRTESRGDPPQPSPASVAGPCCRERRDSR